MISKRHLAAAFVALGVGSTAVEAQQNLPRPIVLYRPPSVVQPPRGQAKLVTTSAASRDATTTGAGSPNAWSGNSARPLTINPSAATTLPGNGSQAAAGMGSRNPGVQPASQVSPQNQPGQSQTNQTQSGQTGNSLKTPEQEWVEQQTRPTLQMLQNPSGAQSMTHAGFSSSQQMAPNTYFGQQFQNWTNQQPASQSPSTAGELSRFQPGQFGGYVAPNTYVGSGFSSWNNLSQGSISPGATGSWGFNVWP